MKKDLAGVIRKLCIFLERPQLTEEEMEKTLQHLTFKSMKGWSNPIFIIFFIQFLF